MSRRRRARFRAIADGTLVAPDKLKFPALPSVTVATTTHKAYRADYGPDFIAKGIVSQEPPVVGSAFPMLVPQVDADGNELAGVRLPELAVPLATYTGWNLFNERAGPPNVLASMQGSFIPLARSKSERERANDPRRAVEERYNSRDQYLALDRQGGQRSGRPGLSAERRRPAHRRAGRDALGLRGGARDVAAIRQGLGAWRLEAWGSGLGAWRRQNV